MTTQLYTILPPKRFNPLCYGTLLPPKGNRMQWLTNVPWYFSVLGLKSLEYIWLTQFVEVVCLEAKDSNSHKWLDHLEVLKRSSSFLLLLSVWKSPHLTRKLV